LEFKLSIVADFANELHKKYPTKPEVVTPESYPSRDQKLFEVQAVIFDIYGTLINYWDDDFSGEAKEGKLKVVFRQLSEHFGFTATLDKIDPTKPAEQTLFDFYHGLITIKHEESLKSGKTFPEVVIEEVWELIVSMLTRNGYDPIKYQVGSRRDFTKSIAYYYNFFALKRGFFEGVVPALKALKDQNIKLGIISNAQFYTPIDLTLFIRDNSSDGELIDYLDLFDSDLCFFSYEYGVAKPNPMLYRKLFDALYESEILPANTVFVGNDLSLDIKSAEEVGLKTGFFTGHSGSTFKHDLGGTVVPHISFSTFAELPNKLSFYADRKS
jgi:putative hydrolase of the HAD superfamily